MDRKAHLIVRLFSVIAKAYARLLIMLAVLLCHATAQGKQDDRVTLSIKRGSLEKVLEEIRRQTGYNYALQDQWRRVALPVDIEVKNVTVDEALNICFKNQPFTYTIIAKTIVIKERKPSESKETVSVVSTKPHDGISGVVENEEGMPLPGATVELPRLGLKIVADEKGAFFFGGIADGKYEVEVTFVGYEPYRASVEAKGGIVQVPVRLKKTNGNLDEVQIIAYGTTTRRTSTGDVSTVKAADIEKQPVANPLLALEGRVPGLLITQASGFAGSGVTVRIQGINSINSGNDPLYVIDGVPYVSELLPAISTTSGSSGAPLVNHSVAYGNPLSFMNPADIESMDVLKDADATAIYGSRAANGAILITTKKGKAGDQRVEFNLQQGWGKVTRRMKLLSLREFLDMRYEALRNNGTDLASGSPTSADFYDLKVWDTTRYTDWQKVLIGNTAQYADLQSAVSGGTTNSYYTVGAGYHRETTVMPGDFDDQKGSLHFQLNSTSANQLFHLRLVGNYMLDFNRLPSNADGTDLTQTALQLAPDAPPLYNKDGSINWAPDPAGNSTWDGANPLAKLLNSYQNQTSNLVNNVLLSYELAPRLSIKSSFGYTDLQTTEKLKFPLLSTAPELRQNTTRAGEYANSSIRSWIIEPQLSYTATVAKGRLETLAGSTIEQNNSHSEQLTGYGYSTDAAIDDIHSASQVVTGPTIDYTYKYNALFGRINYDWQGRYILNLNGRRDGSSRFGSSSQFHNFGSVAAAWIFTQENIVKKKLPALTFGKLSVSYGTTGNDQIGEYQFFSLYNPATYGVPYQGVNTIQPNNLPNPYLQWEETRKLHFGLGLGFWRDRLLLNADYFHNRTSNQLLGYQLPVTTGFNSISANLPATVQNTGWEISLNTIIVQGDRFKWSMLINFTLPQNKLIVFPGLATSTYANSLVIGKPITIARKFHLAGVDPTSGVYYFTSKTNPFNPQYPDDANVWVNTSPVLYGGMQNTLTYRGVQMDFLLQVAKQNGPNYALGWFPGTTRLNQPVYVLDRWRKPGDVASRQKFDANFSYGQNFLNATASDAAYSDASYIRLKNISISWQAPGKLMKAMHVHALGLYVQAQNLLTLTRYTGLDPETRSSASLPPLRVVTTGLKLTL